MGFAAAVLLLPVHPKQMSCGGEPKRGSPSPALSKQRRGRRSNVPVARLFGPAIFEASKLKVQFLGVDEEKHPGKLHRAYTLTHSDITAKITLAVSNTKNSPGHLRCPGGLSGHICALQHTLKPVLYIDEHSFFTLKTISVLRSVSTQISKLIAGHRSCPACDLLDSANVQEICSSNTINRNQLQGWYNRLQRDEVVAEWKKIQGKMSLHVHCHISGGHFLLDLIASLRYYIFCKELPVVLKAFVHGDEALFSNHPELEEAPVWVYFHSSLPEFNRVECWGQLRDAASTGQSKEAAPQGAAVRRSRPCKVECECCFPPRSLIPWPHDLQEEECRDHSSSGQLQL